MCGLLKLISYGAPLTLCAFQAGMQSELLDFRQDMQLEIGLTHVRLQAVQTAIVYGNFV